MNAAASSTVNACFRLVGRYLDLEHPGALQAQNSHPPLRVSLDDIHGNSALRAAAGTWEAPNIPIAHISTYVVPDEASNAGEPCSHPAVAVRMLFTIRKNSVG
jgi:hypothetical protein